MKDADRFWFKMRGILIAPIYIFSIFISFYETENWQIKASGLCLFLTGLLLRIWSQMHLHYRLRAPRKLTVTGPYVYVRNPIYIGNTLLLAGTTLITELVWLVPLTVLVCFITYSLVIRYEEAHLTEKYGTPYLEYLGSVHRWFPALTRVGYTGEYAGLRYLLPSIRAEAHILLLLVLPVLKNVW